MPLPENTIHTPVSGQGTAGSPTTWPLTWHRSKGEHPYSCYRMKPHGPHLSQPAVLQDTEEKNHVRNDENSPSLGSRFRCILAVDPLTLGSLVVGLRGWHGSPMGLPTMKRRRRGRVAM